MAGQDAVSWLAYAGYYPLLFWAYWFGAHHFDVNGDKTFDAEDVKAFLENGGVVRRNFRQSRTSARRLQQQRKAQQEQAEDQRRHFQQQAALRDLPPPQTDKEIFQLFGVSIQENTVEAEIASRYLDKQAPPWFTIFQSALLLGFWVVAVVFDTPDQESVGTPAYGGLDSFFAERGETDLRWYRSECMDVRAEVWRWWTYQFTHLGAGHVVSNCIMLFLLGIPLEGLHGSPRTWLVFNSGVVGGAACYFLVDAHTPVVGASGGCYAFLEFHLANLIMNWREQQFKWLTVVVLMLVTVLDISTYTFGVASELVSHSVHVGGCVAGLLVGVLLGRNLKVSRWEQALTVIVGVASVTLLASAVFWVATRRGPQNVFEVFTGHPPTCWVRQLHSPSINPSAWECVSCWSPACIERWKALTSQIVTVVEAECFSVGFFQRED